LTRGEDDSLPPRTLVMDVTMTHDRYGHTTQHTNGAFTHRVSSTGAPHPDGVLNKSTRMKIRHYRQIYTDRTDPIVFLPIVVSSSGRVYEDFARLFFLHAHREVSILDASQSLCNAGYRILKYECVMDFIMTWVEKHHPPGDINSDRMTIPTLSHILLTYRPPPNHGVCSSIRLQCRCNERLKKMLKVRNLYDSHTLFFLTDVKKGSQHQHTEVFVSETSSSVCWVSFTSRKVIMEWCVHLDLRFFSGLKRRKKKYELQHTELLVAEYELQLH
jgi:hypothetical protein